MALPLNTDRAALPGKEQRPAATEVVRKLGELQSRGYFVYPVHRLQVLHCDPTIVGADEPLDLQLDNFDVITCGTYRSLRPGGRLVSKGPVMRNGVLETSGNRKTWHRGGVAVLQDETIVVDRMSGGTEVDICARFGQPGNPVTQFLGGGAVMIENGMSITQADIHGRQEFQRLRGSGLNAPEMTKDNHMIVGIRRGMCVVATAMGRSGHQMVADLNSAGFSIAVKFERGSGFFLCDDEWYYQGKNPTGLGITLAR
jgi:hypothetical protein